MVKDFKTTAEKKAHLHPIVNFFQLICHFFLTFLILVCQAICSEYLSSVFSDNMLQGGSSLCKPGTATYQLLQTKSRHATETALQYRGLIQASLAPFVHHLQYCNPGYPFVGKKSQSPVSQLFTMLSAEYCMLFTCSYLFHLYNSSLPSRDPKCFTTFSSQIYPHNKPPR